MLEWKRNIGVVGMVVAAAWFASSLTAAEPSDSLAVVTGRVQLPAGEFRPVIKPEGDEMRLQTNVEREPMPYPKGFSTLSAEEKAQWAEAFYASPEGVAYQQRWQKLLADRKEYRAKIGPKGAFRFDRIPPGQYVLRGEFPDRREQGADEGSDRIAGRVGQIVTVGSEPLDVGVMEIRVQNILRVGERAPQFEIESVDGGKIRLADYAGKYVLLDFWATWCVPCVAETPHFKQVYEKFGSRPDFVFIALSLDSSPDLPKKYHEEKGLPGLRGYLGPIQSSDVYGDYGVNGIPSTWLIGPDGTVVAKGMRGEGILKTVELFLSKHEGR